MATVYLYWLAHLFGKEGLKEVGETTRARVTVRVVVVVRTTSLWPLTGIFVLIATPWLVLVVVMVMEVHNVWVSVGE